jgi:hypothetical protein
VEGEMGREMKKKKDAMGKLVSGRLPSFLPSFFLSSQPPSSLPLSALQRAADNT